MTPIVKKKLIVIQNTAVEKHCGVYLVVTPNLVNRLRKGKRLEVFAIAICLKNDS